jgi:hypothetical protein
MSKRAVLLKALASMLSDVERILTGLKAAQEHQHSPLPIATILTQLVYNETKYHNQLREIVRTERPRLPAIQPAAVIVDSERPLDDLAESFFRSRRETLGFLNELSPAAWQRRATHEEWGDTSLRWLVQRLVEQDTRYLHQLLGAHDTSQQTINNVAPEEVASRYSGQLNPDRNSEGKDDRRRTRKWPRKRRRGN